MSIFSGLWISIRCVEYIYSNQPIIAAELQHLFIGERDEPNTLSVNQLLSFTWQSLIFQLVDRLINGFIVTLSPLLKRYTMIFDGSWLQITWRCDLMLYLIIDNRTLPIVNPNYSFYACLMYWRWSDYDLIVLMLPYISIIIWELTLGNVHWLHNPKYFTKTKRKRS